MIEFETRKVEKDIPIKFTCNKSGKEVDLTTDDNYVEQNLTHSFKVHFGYGSIFDMDTWEFDLDESVLLEFVKTFKIRPTGFADGAKYPDKVFEEWKETGKCNWRAGWTEEEFQEEKERREAAKVRQKKAFELLNKMQNK